MKVDFHYLKTNISLPDFLIKIGWKFAPGSSNSSPKMTNGLQTVVIKKNKMGEYTCWDVHSDKRGMSIIDLLQEEIFSRTGRQPSLREVGEILQKYISNNEIILTNESKYNVSESSSPPSFIAALMHELKPYSGTFLESRGISKSSLDSPFFSGVFLTRDVIINKKKYSNTCIKMINEKGLQGISQRGVRDADNKSFKGLLGNKYNSIAVSNHLSDKPVDCLFIGESMIDCISHFQLKKEELVNKNVLYISTEGNITIGQIELIKKLVDHLKIWNNIAYIFDNDISGYKYTLKLDGFLKNGQIAEVESLSKEEIISKVKSLPNVHLSIHNDWNDDLKEKTLSLNTPL